MKFIRSLVIVLHLLDWSYMLIACTLGLVIIVPIVVCPENGLVKLAPKLGDRSIHLVKNLDICLYELLINN